MTPVAIPNGVQTVKPSTAELLDRIAEVISVASEKRRTAPEPKYRNIIGFRGARDSAAAWLFASICTVDLRIAVVPPVLGIFALSAMVLD